MPKELKLKLDDTEYTFPAMNIGQLQKCADVMKKGDFSGGLDILKIIFERATPQPNWDTFSPTMEEIGSAVREVLGLSGMGAKADDPQKAAA
jgi:hypothetical protein